MALRTTAPRRRLAGTERVAVSPYKALMHSLIMAGFAAWSLAVPHLGLPLRYAALPFLTGLLLSLPLAMTGLRQIAEDGFSPVLMLAVMLDLAAFMALATLGYMAYRDSGGIPAL